MRSFPRVKIGLLFFLLCGKVQTMPFEVNCCNKIFGKRSFRRIAIYHRIIRRTASCSPNQFFSFSVSRFHKSYNFMRCHSDYDDGKKFLVNSCFWQNIKMFVRFRSHDYDHAHALTYISHNRVIFTCVPSLVCVYLGYTQFCIVNISRNAYMIYVCIAFVHCMQPHQLSPSANLPRYKAILGLGIIDQKMKSLRLFDSLFFLPLAQS